jgi:hypothetical protein
LYISILQKSLNVETSAGLRIDQRKPKEKKKKRQKFLGVYFRGDGILTVFPGCKEPLEYFM